MVKPAFPIGKTQWAKWLPEQQIAFNETRAAGVPFADAVKYVNELELVEVNIAPPPPPKKKKNVFDIIQDVTGAAAAISPVVAIAKTLIKKGK